MVSIYTYFKFGPRCGLNNPINRGVPPASWAWGMFGLKMGVWKTWFCLEMVYLANYGIPRDPNGLYGKEALGRDGFPLAPTRKCSLADFPLWGDLGVGHLAIPDVVPL